MTKEFVDESCPYDLKPYELAHELKMQEQDTISWISGMYVKNALEVVLGGLFGAGNNSYMDKSIMAEMNKYASMTDEEIDEMEIRKMIAEEDAYNRQLKANGVKTFGQI